MKRMVVDMENELHTAVKIEALRQGKSTKQFVTEMIQKELAKKEEQRNE